MLTAASVDLKFIFNEAVDPALLAVIDQTNYAALGIDLVAFPNAIAICLKCEVLTSAGNVVFYDNLTQPPVQADIITGISNSNVIPIPLPLDNEGNAVKGQYTFTALIIVNDGINLTYAVNWSQTYDYDFEEPCIKITARINCMSSTITSIDATDYGIYATTIVRVHTIFPPPASGLPPLVSPLQTLIYNNIVTTTWSTEISSTVTFTLSNGLITIRLLEGSIEYKVQCESDLKKFFCCLATIVSNMERYMREEPAKYKEKEAEWNRVRDRIALYMLAVTFGCTDKAAALAEEIKSLTQCGDCGPCNDSNPQQVIPVQNGGQQVIVDSPLGTIMVTPDLQGNVMYFHIEKIVPASSLTVVSTNTPIYLEVVPIPIVGGINYQVNFKGITTLLGRHEELWIIIAKIGANWVLTVAAQYIRGDGWQPFASQVFELGSNFPAPPVDTDIVIIHGSNIVAPGFVSPFLTVRAQLNNVNTAVNSTNIKAYYGQYSQMECQVFHVDLIDKNVFDLRIINPINGQPLTFGELRELTENAPFTISCCIIQSD